MTTEREIVIDSDALYRRLLDEDFKGERVLKNLKSSAFSDTSREPSFHLKRLADFEAIGKRYPETILYAVCIAGIIRQHNFDAEHRPCKSDYSHSVIFSSEMDLGKQTVRRRLKKLVSQLDLP